jgi:hypothetical protein
VNLLMMLYCQYGERMPRYHPPLWRMACMYYHVWNHGEGGKICGSVQKILVVCIPGRPVGGELPPLTVTSIAEDHRC